MSYRHEYCTKLDVSRADSLKDFGVYCFELCMLSAHVCWALWVVTRFEHHFRTTFKSYQPEHKHASQNCGRNRQIVRGQSYMVAKLSTVHDLSRDLVSAGKNSDDKIAGSRKPPCVLLPFSIVLL
eukprot:4911105-Amphidinium_carterae.2